MKVREAITYRGAKYNAERGPRRSLLLKERRKSLGCTRADLDRAARQAADARKAAT